MCLLTFAGCTLFGPNRSPKVPAPVVNAADPAQEPPPAKVIAEPAEIPPPPRIETATGDVPAVQAPEAEMETAPPPPEPADKPARESTTRSVPPPKPAPGEATPEPPSAPRLTQLLSDEEKWQYGQEIDERLLRIHQLITELEKRPLKEDQMALLDRVRGFVRQTNESRENDPVTAKNLSERAELLAEELENATR